MSVATAPADVVRTTVRLLVRGRVQGVGFRPFVAGLAGELGLAGWARNAAAAVEIVVAGDVPALEEFRARLVADAPPAARVDRVESEAAETCGDDGFQIRDSDPGSADLMVDVPPDLATCPACLAEFDDPRSPRGGHALLGCVDCGPRYTLIESLPFDRARTTLSSYCMCAACETEYQSTWNRRFHAENTTCAACGPRLRLEPGPGRDIGDLDRIERAADVLREGGIVAVKGVGGFHLVCDATSSVAVETLRARKRREAKPFAVVFADIGRLEAHAAPDAAERSALLDRSAPIVLVRRREASPIVASVAPGLRTLGAMLAYTPTLRALTLAVGRPLVVTSANAGGEPIPIAREELLSASPHVADAVLDHDRPILRHADDSVVRIVGGGPKILRAGRGLAPIRLRSPVETPPTLALGGGMKVAVAVGHRHDVVLGPHIGELDTPAARDRFRASAFDFCRLLNVRPERIAHDAHPDYFTTRFAVELGLPRVAVGHHEAHFAACLAEHGHWGPALGVVWDGAGLGADGGIWGGEFLLRDDRGVRRVGSIWPFPLIGGDRAAREPRRSALGVHLAAGEPPSTRSFTESELRALVEAARVPRLAPTCTGVGRLFDAWASLLGILDRSAYEAEAATLFEEIADAGVDDGFDVEIVEHPSGIPRLDWRPWVAETRRLLACGFAPGRIAAMFHNGLARGCLAFARRIGCGAVALTGGCFQNRYLSERVERSLASDGFHVLTHRLVPPGDGGLAVGQIVAAAWSGGSSSCV